MWIQVRSMDGKKSVRIDGLSKLTKIEELRDKLVDSFDAPGECQRLFYRGKELVDGHSLFDYDVGLNEIIQILIRQKGPADAVTQLKNAAEKVKGESVHANNRQLKEVSESESTQSTYKVGDVIDARDETVGAWFEAKIVSVVDRKSKPTSQDTKEQKSGILPTDTVKSLIGRKVDIIGQDDGFAYTVVFETYENDGPVVTSSCHIRPRARNKVAVGDIDIGAHVLVNYNSEEPTSRGFWYDAITTHKNVSELTATVFIGKDLIPSENCKIVFVDEIFQIEKPATQLNIDCGATCDRTTEKCEENRPTCDYCKDDPNKRCKRCACSVCGDKREPEKQLMCDECDCAYHIYCLKPPLTEIPDVEEWYCPECKNDTNEVVMTGQKLKESKKKSKMASAQSQTTRDWGKGMACVGRSKQCTIVPPNHFGAIPGVEVGSQWKFRVQVSEAGVHRPHVAGIHGRDGEGAYSIVLSGGYEDDKDDGDEFMYTGSGGRDLSGNKRTAEQSCDQTLTRMNRALAKNCSAPLDPKNGAEAKDWKAGKPVRVVRNCKGCKHSEYAPEEGNRYDGIYKVVKYWPEKGMSGFIVWRYLLRRDDPTPAPWTDEGKKRIKELGLTMQYPEGWQDKNNNESEEEEESPSKAKKKRKTSKRKRVTSDDSEDESEQQPAKKSSFCVSEAVSKLIKADARNEKLWNDALTITEEGLPKFLEKVTELFQCICCQEIVYQPISTDCSHNLCKECLKRAFRADVHCCPMCRTDLGKDFKMVINDSLQAALSQLFPGYETGR